MPNCIEAELTSKTLYGMLLDGIMTCTAYKINIVTTKRKVVGF